MQVEVLTKQEIFDNAYRGLAAQGWRKGASETQDCRFRIRDRNSGEVLKCAIGHSIPDDKYKSSMERFGPQFALEMAGIKLADDVTVDWLQELQNEHDGSLGSDSLQQNLKDFARQHKLKVPKI